MKSSEVEKFEFRNEIDALKAKMTWNEDRINDIIDDVSDKEIERKIRQKVHPVLEAEILGVRTLISENESKIQNLRLMKGEKSDGSINIGAAQLRAISDTLREKMRQLEARLTSDIQERILLETN